MHSFVRVRRQPAAAMAPTTRRPPDRFATTLHASASYPYTMLARAAASAAPSLLRALETRGLATAAGAGGPGKSKARQQGDLSHIQLVGHLPAAAAAALPPPLPSTVVLQLIIPPLAK